MDPASWVWSASRSKHMEKEKKVEIVTPIKHANIYSALSAFQGELKPMAKTGTVEFETAKGKVKFDYTAWVIGAP
mgnify:CR=1 FL=1